MKRQPSAIRQTTIEPFPSAAPGSVLIRQGHTQVICTASVEAEPPKWLKDAAASGQTPKGWVTAEYAMLPGSTLQRKKRGSDSRATEIQRLIGRVLRSAVDLTQMPGIVITVDCDVVQADGGTRCASITGGWVALAQAIAWAKKQGIVTGQPMARQVAAISVGIIDGRFHLDLDYDLDHRAQVDLNVAMDDAGRLVEVQGTAEGRSFSRQELDHLLDLAEQGVRKLQSIQRRAAAPHGRASARCPNR